MVRIGRFEFGWLAFSVLVVFVTLTCCVTFASYRFSSGDYVREELGRGFWHYWLWLETMALVFTLMYGVVTHFVFALFSRLNKKQ